MTCGLLDIFECLLHQRKRTQFHTPKKHQQHLLYHWSLLISKELVKTYYSTTEKDWQLFLFYSKASIYVLTFTYHGNLFSPYSKRLIKQMDGLAAENWWCLSVCLSAFSGTPTANVIQCLMAVSWQIHPLLTNSNLTFLMIIHMCQIWIRLIKIFERWWETTQKAE